MYPLLVQDAANKAAADYSRNAANFQSQTVNYATGLMSSRAELVAMSNSALLVQLADLDSEQRTAILEQYQSAFDNRESAIYAVKLMCVERSAYDLWFPGDSLKPLISGQTGLLTPWTLPS